MPTPAETASKARGARLLGGGLSCVVGGAAVLCGMPSIGAAAGASDGGRGVPSRLRVSSGIVSADPARDLVGGSGGLCESGAIEGMEALDEKREGALFRGATMESLHGFNVRRWSENGLNLWAVSDIEADVLQDFGEKFEAALKQ